jgi:hypothetical protein
MEIVETSCTQVRGLEAWLAWVERRRQHAMRA